MEAVIPAGAAPLVPSSSPGQGSGRSLERIVPAPLRVDIIMRRQFFKNEEYYVLKDPLALTYFRLQPEEAYILTLLDGKRTLLEISQRFATRYPNHARSLMELAQFVNQLGASGILNVSANRFVENARRKRPGSGNALMTWAKLISSTLFLKIPLIDPSPWLGKLVHAIRFVWTKWFVASALLLFAWTAGLLLVNADAFAVQRIDFFSASNLMLLWVSVIAIKTLHEFGHATTCRRFGGEVHEMGVCLMCFTPCGYVDASDAWMMRHKRHKLFVTIAGVFTELILASIAAHLWLVLPDGIGRSLAFNAMIVASINTVIFNINPLMRFDGYYVLCDLLEIPNLRTKALTFCSYHLQRIFFGYRNQQQEALFEEEAHGHVFVLYAVFAYGYMVFLIYSLTQIFARILEPVGLHDFGLYLGYFVQGSFVAFPFVKIFMDAARPAAHVIKTGSTRRRLALTLGGLAGAAALSFAIPARHHIHQQAIVMADSVEMVASEVGGVIARVHVHTGQWVNPGDLLVTLENPEVTADLAILDAERRQAQVRLGALRAQGGWMQAESQASMVQQIEVAETAYARAAGRAAQLELRAKSAGYVLTAEADKLVGRYASPFYAILRLGDTRRLRLVIPLTEDEAQLVEPGATVSGRWQATGRSFETTLAAVSSQPARPADYHIGMLAYFGGPAPSQLMQSGAAERAKYPIFLATAELPPPDHAVVEGLRTRVEIEGRATTLGRKAWRSFLSLFDLKTAART